MAEDPDEWELVPLNPTEHDQTPCTTLSFMLNGKSVSVENPDPEMLLVEYIRDVAGLKGMKRTMNEAGKPVSLARFSQRVTTKTITTVFLDDPIPCLRGGGGFV